MVRSLLFLMTKGHLILVDLGSSNMEHSLFYSDGRTNIKNAEDDIISNILDFDPWDESLTSPHNFAKLLGQSAHRANILEHNEQSRFSFARHEESNNQAYGNKSYGIYGQLSRDQPHQEFGVNRDMYQDKLGSQRRLPNDRRETLPEPSNILISTKKQDRELSTTTTSSYFLIKVMPKAFWSLSSVKFCIYDVPCKLL